MNKIFKLISYIFLSRARDSISHCVGQSVGPLVRWSFVGPLVRWSLDPLVGPLIGPLIGPLVCWSVCLFVGWLVGLS